MNLEQRLYNGDRAREILENEVFTQVFDDIETEILTQWKSSPARDLEGREKLWQLLSLLGKLKSTLQTTLDTGKLAKLELEHKRSLAQRLTAAKSEFSRG
jgi:hypothetical protein